MRPAILAAVEAGAGAGVHTSAPTLLQETNNTVVWLRPAPVVAKVATRRDAKVDVCREHAVATELAALGALTATPLPGSAPVEHPATGFVVTLWERLDGRHADVPADSLAKALTALHVSLARPPLHCHRFERSSSGHGARSATTSSWRRSSSTIECSSAPSTTQAWPSWMGSTSTDDGSTVSPTTATAC